MRFLYTSLALGVGLLGLIPESAGACPRRGVRGGYAVTYSPTVAYYPQPVYPPPGYALQPSITHQSFYPPAVAPAASITTAAVALYDNRFEPATITVAPGTTIRWTNSGSHKHTVTSATGAWDSGDLAPGQVYSATFTRPGTYEYFCHHHKEMKGTIVVK